MVLANFRDARRALDQARTAHGFIPVRNPNLRDAKGAGKARCGKRDRRKVAHNLAESTKTGSEIWCAGFCSHVRKAESVAPEHFEWAGDCGLWRK